MKPLFNNVIIKPVKEDKKTESGIVLPETADKKKQSKGTVIAVGPGKVTDQGNLISMSVKQGDLVLFKEPWSDDNKIKNENGEEEFVVSEDDILAIIE